MRRKLSVVLLFAFVVSCAPKNLPPESVPAYRATEILTRIDELQKTVIDLYDHKGITKERADLIVGFTVNAAQILRDTKVGWQESLKAAWSQLQQRVPVPEGTLKTIWNVLGSLINSIQQEASNGMGSNPWVAGQECGYPRAYGVHYEIPGSA